VARLDKTPFEVVIDGMSHDGRGVVSLPDGKTLLVAGALPGERVMAARTGRHRGVDEARTVEVLQAAPERVEPRCAHFGTCGGCAMQHYAGDRQILAKQHVLLENLRESGGIVPARVLEPLTDATWGYRRKGRFSVRRVEKKGKTLVGFRETDPRFVADIAHCHTVIPEVGEKVEALAALVESLQARREIPQI
jgi:23S rRNA (uracil1939-C5)-methyltransferase